MEALLIYIAKSSGLIVLFYCAYYFLLRKETFFSSNRWFLLTGLITSAILPFFVYTKTVWIDPVPIPTLDFAEANLVQNIEAEGFEINWFYVVLAIYSIGFVALLIKFGIDYYSLRSVLKGKKIQQQADFKFIDTNENIAPFSYFEYIVYNSSMYTPVELENIIEHEKVHSDQNHTIDVLVSRAFCMLFWFNPVIWFYKKAITQNLEFIADKEAAEKLADKKAYQYTLLKITTHENCVAITNHFYQSLIKKRIVMLNKNQSKKRNSWKYYTVIPALVAFVLLFQVEVIAKEKQQVLKEVSNDIKSVDVYKIKKNTTDAELKTLIENLKKLHEIETTLSEVKRNSNNEITTIKVELTKGTELSKTFLFSGSKAIQDCGIIIVTHKDGTKEISFKSQNEAGDTLESKDSKVEIKKVKTTKTTTNVNTNSTSDTKTSSTDNTNTDITVTSNANGKNSSTVVITSKSKPVVHLSDKLIIVDGEVVAGASTDDLQKLSIKSMNVLTGENAIKEYGEDGKNGVIIIETRK